MSVVGFSNPIQIQAEGILSRGGVFAALEFAAFTAQHADLLNWAEACLRAFEHRGDMLAEALLLLRPKPAAVTRSAVPAQPPQKKQTAAASANLDDPRQLLVFAWQNIHDHDRRLAVVLSIAGSDPALLERVAALARHDRIPLPVRFSKLPVMQLVPVEECSEPMTVRLDPELGRLAIGLKQGGALRVWAVARSLVRQGRGAGWVSRGALHEALLRLGVPLSPRHLRRLLSDGAGRFWNLHEKRIYLYSPSRAALHLVRLAEESRHTELIETNLPGVRDVYIPADGSLAEWEAHLYAAWLSYRSNPTIARDTLSKLFGRDPDTLRRWERERLAGIVTVRRNDVQCGEDQQTAWDYLPDHAYFYLANVRGEDGLWKRESRIRWRMANTYLVSTFRQHPKKGQARKVRGTIEKETAFQPADEKRGGAPGARLYFEKPNHLKRYCRKHGPNPRGRFLWRGENQRGHGIFEHSEYGEYLTYPNERAHPRAERLWGIQQHWYDWRPPHL